MDQGLEFQADADCEGSIGSIGSIGAYATRDMSRGEVVLVLPRICCLGPRPALLQSFENTCMQHVEYRRTFGQSAPPDELALAVTMMLILAGKSNHDDSLARHQSNTWPSVKEMKATSIFYGDEQTIDRILGKSALKINLGYRRQHLRQNWEQIVYPTIQKDASSNLSHFILPEFQSLQDESQALWESFRYAYSLVFSRNHESGSIIPLVELFNGYSSLFQQDMINVRLVNSNPEKTTIVTCRDIVAGEQLFISYGELPPSGFLIKYGAIPDQMLRQNPSFGDTISLTIPPSLVPSDDLRRNALQHVHGYPIQAMRAGIENKVLTPQAFYQNQQNQHVESPDVASVRQFLVLGNLCTDEEVQRSLSTGRLRCQTTPEHIGQLLVQSVDYSVALLLQNDSDDSAKTKTKTSSAQDMEHAQETHDSWESLLLRGRVCQREALLQWRHLFCKRYNCSGLTVDNTDGGGCFVCGRTWPKLTCSRCKEAHYCCRTHQKQDWKQHKGNCSSF